MAHYINPFVPYGLFSASNDQMIHFSNIKSAYAHILACRHGNKLLGHKSPVVNMFTVRLILLIARIYNLHSKAIDFVLTLPQDDLDVDIWKSSIKITKKNIKNGATDDKSSRKYILKLNKSLY